MSIKSVAFKIHEYAGIITLLPLIVIAITGSLLSFEREIDRTINASILVSDTAGPALPPSRIIDSARAYIGPYTGSPTFIWYPEAMGTAVIVGFDTKGEGDDPLDQRYVSVDPMTGRVLGERRGGGFFGVVRELHAALLLGHGGEVLVGLLGFVLAASVITGLVNWWPKMNWFGRSLRMRFDLGTLRAMYDFHRAGGVYAAIVLLAVAISGTVFPFGQEWEKLTAIVSPVRPKLPQHETRAENRPVISIDRVFDIAKTRFPTGRFVYADFPAGPDGTFRAVLNQPGELSDTFGATKLWIDPYTGEILSEIDALGFSTGEKFNNALVWIHSGHILGMGGRILVFASGFALAALCISGLYLWIRRQRLLWRGRSKRRKRMAGEKIRR